jgi:hypothetical protein
MISGNREILVTVVLRKSLADNPPQAGNKKQGNTTDHGCTKERSTQVFVPFHCLDSARALRAKSYAGVIEIACSQSAEALTIVPFILDAVEERAR